MSECPKYDSYPARIVLVTLLHSLLTYALGAYILSGFGVVWVAPYLIYCLALRLRLVKAGCPDCWYYGKVCGLGLGWLSGRLFGPGDPRRFVSRKFTWLDLLPDMLVAIIPLVGGVVLLVMSFNWLLLGAVLALVLLAGPGNGFMHGSLLCRHCRQHDLGCPACDLFSKHVKEDG